MLISVSDEWNTVMSNGCLNVINVGYQVSKATFIKDVLKEKGSGDRNKSVMSIQHGKV